MGQGAGGRREGGGGRKEEEHNSNTARRERVCGDLVFAVTRRLLIGNMTIEKDGTAGVVALRCVALRVGTCRVLVIHNWCAASILVKLMAERERPWLPRLHPRHRTVLLPPPSFKVIEVVLCVDLLVLQLPAGISRLVRVESVAMNANTIIGMDEQSRPASAAVVECWIDIARERGGARARERAKELGRARERERESERARRQVTLS